MIFCLFVRTKLHSCLFDINHRPLAQRKRYPLVSLVRLCGCDARSKHRHADNISSTMSRCLAALSNELSVSAVYLPNGSEAIGCWRGGGSACVRVRCFSSLACEICALRDVTRTCRPPIYTLLQTPGEKCCL